jgi:hypothetical protein
MADVMEEAELPESPAENPNLGGGGDDASMVANVSSRMVVKTVNLTLQTTEFDMGVEDIEAVVLDYGGFMQESQVQGKAMFEKYGTRYASFTARIPTEKLESFITEMGQKYNIINKHQSGEDITDRYYDTDARLNSLKVQEQRLIAMLEQAGELEYLLQVERELANVRYEIESLTASLARMQNQVSMSTVYLSLEEVIEYTPVEPVPVTFGERLSRAFSESWLSFKNFMQGLVIAVIWLLPFIILLGVIAAVIIILSLRARKRRKRNAAVLPPNPPVEINSVDHGPDNNADNTQE